MSLKPFLHQHHLLYDEYEKQEACCDKCNLNIDGWAFTCEICKFWLHESCALQQMPPKISHPLHPQHPLQLVSYYFHPGRHFFCDGCSSLTRNYLYQCRDCNFNLDLICTSSATITSHRYKQISHFCHRHSLTGFKYRKVSKYHYTCFWCEKLLSGVSYGCFEFICTAESFVHETCLMNMPNIISKHHFHPSHQLQLTSSYRGQRSFLPCGVCGYSIKNTIEGSFRGFFDGYYCLKCKFFIHYSCVKFKPILKHELHHHRLTLLPSKPIFSSNFYLEPCEKCGQEIYSDKDSVRNYYYYRCVPCGFNFHLFCLILSSVRHKYHRHELMLTHVFLEDYSDQYYCDVCEEERKPGDPVYCCNKCTFVAHIGCALNQIKDESTCSLVGEKVSIRKLNEGDEIKETNANLSTHFEFEYCNEGHGLIFYEAIEKHERGATCFVCSVKISDEAYACKSCRFYLHKTCIRWSFEVTHPLHLQHSLKLSPWYADYLDNWYKCQGCAIFNIGFAYVCYACDFALDVKCATSWVPKTETQRLKDMETQSKLCLFNQHHNLHYVNYGLNLHFISRCSFCGLYLSGLNYRCSECDYGLHERCVEIPREIKIQLHPLHLLRPLLYPPQHCRVCGFSFRIEISYSCVQCDLYFHVDCAKSLKHVLKSKSHIHDLYYFGSSTDADHCYKRNICSECERWIDGIFFCFCMECKVKLHIEHVLPPSLKSKYHIHPLTLEIGFKADDSGEYYCDVCEEERELMTLTGHVYHCTQCRVPFVAHLHCALNSVEKTAASSNLALDSCPSAS